LRFTKPKNPQNSAQKIDFLTRFIATGIFIGHIPVASGTFGSLLALVIFLIPGFSDIRIMAVSIVVFFFIGVLAAERMQRRYGFDPPEVVIDEIVGLWFTFLAAVIVNEVFIKYKTYDPLVPFFSKLVFGVTCFLLFRFFDIIKLQPAKYLEELKSGWGIMLDDIIAGLYAGILSTAVWHFLWSRVFIKLL
jgi:phosphatidylglycerophosphatase A